MGLAIYWTDFAKSEVKVVFNYLKRTENISFAKKFVSEILLEPNILSLFPELGQIEENLIQSSKEYRYLIYKNYKIIYWINLEKNQIEIMDVFDCRQDIVNIKRNK